MFQLYFVSLTLKGYEQFSVNRSYVFHLAGHLRTAILADHHLGILSKHSGNRGNNDTLFKSVYDTKNISCLFERPFKIQKNGVFLFEMSFFVLEILTFFYYAN